MSRITDPNMSEQSPAFHAWRKKRLDEQTKTKGPKEEKEERQDEAYLPTTQYGSAVLMKLAKFKKLMNSLRGDYVTIDGTSLLTLNDDLERIQTLSISSEDIFDIEKERKEREARRAKSESLATVG